MSPEKTAVAHDAPISAKPEAWQRCWLVAFLLHWPWVCENRYDSGAVAEVSVPDVSYSGKGFSKPMDVQCAMLRNRVASIMYCQRSRKSSLGLHEKLQPGVIDMLLT